jgi:hypothetical protein
MKNGALVRWLAGPSTQLASAFGVPFLLRVVPQILAGPAAPVGYDTTAGYAPFASLVQRYGLGQETVLLSQAHMAPLLWLLIGALALAGVSPFALLEVLTPILYGVLGSTLWRFCKRGLSWNSRHAGFGMILVLAYFLPLRYGWDNLKDVLGVSFLLLALAEVPHFPARRRYVFFAVFAAASVLSEEVEAVLLGAISGILFLNSLRMRRWSPTWLTTGLACLALVLFYAGVIGAAGPGPFPPYGLPGPAGTAPPFLQGVVDYPSWIAKAWAATLLIGIGLLPLAYPAWRGRLRSPLTDAWALAAGVGTLAIFFLPGSWVFPVWPTWLVLLSFPLGLSAARGLTGMDRRHAAVFIGALVVLSGGFLVLTPDKALPYFTSRETRWYIPTSMVQTTIPMDRVAGVKAAVGWLNEHATSSDWIVVSNVFAGFVMVLGDPTHLYPYYRVDTVDWRYFSNASLVYTIYWSNLYETWFAGGMPPNVFVSVFAFGGVSVLAAQGPTVSSLQTHANSKTG